MSDPSTPREATIRALLPLVKRIARRVKGWFRASISTIRRRRKRRIDPGGGLYDPSRGPSLQQYAHRLIVGSMLNGIRRMDPVSERARRTVRDGENQRYAIAASARRGAAARKRWNGIGRDIFARWQRRIAGSRCRWMPRCRSERRFRGTGATIRRCIFERRSRSSALAVDPIASETPA